MFRNVGMKERLVDRVVNEIQNQIVEGKLVPGMMLPPERELCEQLGVSRTALREAVRMLVTKGLLETRPGVGTTVRQIHSDQISGPLSLMLNRLGGDLDHLNQVRQILEVEIVRLAAANATEEDLDHLQDIYREMAAAVQAHEDFSSLDGEFHRALAEITHNPLLVILLDSIQDMMQDIRLLVQEYQDLPETVVRDHEKILKAILSKDPNNAAQAMKEHLDHARSIQKKVLNGKEEDPPE